MDAPRRGVDPLALAILGVAACLIVGIGAYVAWKWWSAPKPVLVQPPPVAAKKPAPPPTVAQKPVPPPQQKEAAPVPAQLMLTYGAGRVWTYQVTVEPAVWRDATLSYRLVEKNGARVVNAEFRHARGDMKFELGTFLAGHPSHADMRFPGFFMHAAYLDRPLEVGQRFVWQWPWQTPDGRVVSGRIKRYEGEVKAWENLPAPPGVRAPADRFFAARIETTLSYIDGSTVRATARETLWYAPRYLQMVKVVREGRTPDESAQFIVVELVRHDAQ